MDLNPLLLLLLLID